MPSLLSIYTSAAKTKKTSDKTKGEIISDIQTALKMPYPTVRRKILEESFSYPEKIVICQTYDMKMEDLFPEPAFSKI